MLEMSQLPTSVCNWRDSSKELNEEMNKLQNISEFQEYEGKQVLEKMKNYHCAEKIGKRRKRMTVGIVADFVLKVIFCMLYGTSNWIIFFFFPFLLDACFGDFASVTSLHSSARCFLAERR